MRAFDSIDWTLLKELLLSNLTRKINKETAEELVEHYMIIIENRELRYNNIVIPVSKGIPTGLPSSNLIFTFIMEEVLYRWLNKYNYQLDIDFIMNVYVDDIYLKFIRPEIANKVVSSLISHLEEYKLRVNRFKSKGDGNLKLIDLPNIINENDFYLGIPFTRNIKLYGELILKEYQQKYNSKKSWNDIYDDLLSDDMDISTKIQGYLNYKLNPMILSNEQITKKDIIKFIRNNYYEPEYINMIIFTGCMILLFFSVIISMQCIANYLL